MLVKQYAVYKSGELIGTHTAVEIEKLTGCNKTSVRNYAENGNPYNKIYTFEYIEKGESDKVFDTFIQEWNEIMSCAKLISSGQAVIRQIGNEKYTCLKKGKGVHK